MAISSYIFDSISDALRISDVQVLEHGKIAVSGIQYRKFRDYIHDIYGSIGFIDRFLDRSYGSVVVLDQFFLPELVYLLTNAAEAGYLWKMKVSAILDAIYTKTWMSTTKDSISTDWSMKKFHDEFVDEFHPMDHQLEFCRDIYCQRKAQWQLHGYLLSLEMGLAKTATSLMLKAGLGKLHAIVVCPYSTISSVWTKEINQWHKTEKTIWTPRQNIADIDDTYEFIIVNYESLSKVHPTICKKLDPERTIIIVDESHNLKDYKAKRTIDLYNLNAAFNCKDMLLMSGTPLKALASETISIFKLIDPMFNDEIAFKLKELCRYSKVINDLLRNRLGQMMYRKLKSEVLKDLPVKHEQELKIKIPDGKKYTLDSVKSAMQKYAQERAVYHRQHEEEYRQVYMECIGIYESKLTSMDERVEFAKYRSQVETIRRLGPAPDIMPMIAETNKFEKEKIIPSLPVYKRKAFRDAKAGYKYIQLKILGEVLGGLVNQLRIEMTSKIVGNEVFDIIRNAEKKTILFTSYIDTISLAEQLCKQNRLQPLVITGANTKEAKDILDKFRTQVVYNPLIASIQAMSTGHTVIEANTIIFLNVPFRSVDYDQASDRIYRIGQDTDVYIYKLVLDTGDEPNLSTRMHDIVKWSAEQFNAIVGDDAEELQITSDIRYAFTDPTLFNTLINKLQRML